MALYENWVSMAYNKEGQAIQHLWDQHVPLEQKIYEEILEKKIDTMSGTPCEWAIKYGMTTEGICGFIDGIKEACIITKNGEATPFEIEKLEETDQVTLRIDFKKLFMKMVEYKAEHLYTLPGWTNIFSIDEQKEIYFEQKKSGTIVKAKDPGRNDPCSCGSGKKFKKCCAS